MRADPVTRVPDAMFRVQEMLKIFDSKLRVSPLEAVVAPPSAGGRSPPPWERKQLEHFHA